MPYGGVFNNNNLGWLGNLLSGFMSGGPAQQIGPVGSSSPFAQQAMQQNQNSGFGGWLSGLFNSQHSGPTANPYIQQVANTANQAGSRSGLPPLDANTQNALNQITNAANAHLQQQFQDRSNALIQNLYGMGAEHSSGANAAAARMLQDNQLVSEQAQADAAQRFLSQQNTSADRSLQGLGMQQQGLGQAANLTNEQNQLAQQQQMQQFQAIASLLPQLFAMRQQQQQQGGQGAGSPAAPTSYATQRPPSQNVFTGGHTNSGAIDTTQPWAGTQGAFSPEMQQWWNYMLRLQQMGLGGRDFSQSGYNPLQYAQTQAGSMINSQNGALDYLGNLARARAQSGTQQ